MSNRRRLPKDRKPRCKKCRNALLEKRGYSLVCEQCGTSAPTTSTLPARGEDDDR